MQVGDLVRYRSAANKTEWLGLIVREIPGTAERKVIEWMHRDGGTDRGSYKARDLELVNENR
jgi:hypothetical protein